MLQERVISTHSFDERNQAEQVHIESLSHLSVEARFDTKFASPTNDLLGERNNLFLLVHGLPSMCSENYETNMYTTCGVVIQ